MAQMARPRWQEFQCLSPQGQLGVAGGWVMGPRWRSGEGSCRLPMANKAPVPGPPVSCLHWVFWPQPSPNMCEHAWCGGSVA